MSSISEKKSAFKRRRKSRFTAFALNLFAGANKSLTTLVYNCTEFSQIDDPLLHKEINQRGENRVSDEAVPKLGVCKLVIGLDPFVHHTHPLPGLMPYLDYTSAGEGHTRRKQQHENRHLDTNKKTKIFYMRQGVNAYGFKIKATHMMLRTESKRREKRRIKAMVRKMKEGRITRAAVVQAVNSWLGFARWASAYNLAKKIFAPYRFIKTEGAVSYTHLTLPTTPYV